MITCNSYITNMLEWCWRCYGGYYNNKCEIQIIKDRINDPNMFSYYVQTIELNSNVKLTPLGYLAITKLFANEGWASKFNKLLILK